MFWKECLNQTVPVLVRGNQKQSLYFRQGVLCVEGQPFNLLEKINLGLPKGLLPVE